MFRSVIRRSRRARNAVTAGVAVLTFALAGTAIEAPGAAVAGTVPQGAKVDVQGKPQQDLLKLDELVSRDRGEATAAASRSGSRTAPKPDPKPAPKTPARRPADWLEPSQIARAVGAPERDVASNWPKIDNALKTNGLGDPATRIAAIATIVTEVGTSFRPVGEYGGRAYFSRMYDGRADLGNHQPGDGWRFHGRGYIQLTGRANYASYGKRLGVDLVRKPDMALRADVGARVLADYFKQRGVAASARQGDWRGTRIKVNGGLNGWSRYQQVVHRLLDAERAHGKR